LAPGFGLKTDDNIPVLYKPARRNPYLNRADGLFTAVL
jgi:hypothetical protein